MKASAFVAVTLGLLLVGAAHANEPGYGQVAFSIVDGKSAQEVFNPDTQEIVLHVQLVDVTAGETLGATWVAEKTAAAPLNYKIDSVEAPATDADEFQFSLSKPDAGWPVGEYRVDLTIHGKLAKSAHFTVAQ
jgi:hypothetical protein